MPSFDESRDKPSAEGPEDDHALMRGISASDRHAFEQLYDRHSSTVFAFCLRSLGDRSEAEDLALEIFWELWRRQDRYDPTRSSPLTYLMKVTRSRVVDRLRSLRARHAAVPNPTDPRQPLEERRETHLSDPSDQMQTAEAAVRLRAAISQLQPDQRKALEMAYFDAMTYGQVADSLGQPLGTIKSRIRQALMQLRQILGGGGT